MAGAQGPTVVEILGARAGADIEPMLEVLTRMAARKGDRGTSQGRTRGGGTHGGGEGAASTTAPATSHGHGIGMILVGPSTAVSGPVSHIDRAAARQARDGAGMAGAHGPTVVEVLGARAGADIEPMFGILAGMAARKRDGRTGQSRAGGGRTYCGGEGAASTTAPATSHGHGIGMVLRLPPATVFGVPPDVNGATGRQAGDGAGMAGAHGPTVVEVLGARAGADIEPMFGILAGMAARKRDGRTGQSRAGGGRTYCGGEGAASTTAPATSHGHGIGMILVGPSTAVSGPVSHIDRAAARQARDGAGMAGAHGPTVVEVLGARAGADIEPMFGILAGMAARKRDRGTGQGGARGRGTHRGGEGAASTTAPATSRSNLFFRCRGTLVSCSIEGCSNEPIGCVFKEIGYCFLRRGRIGWHSGKNR